MFREDPWRRYEDKGVGARTALMERRAMELAAAELRAEEEDAEAASAQAQLDGRDLTESRANYRGATPARGDDPSRGKRIMKTQDGAPVRVQAALCSTDERRSPPLYSLLQHAIHDPMPHLHPFVFRCAGPA